MNDYQLEGTLRLTDETGGALHSASENMDDFEGSVRRTERSTSSFEKTLRGARAALVTFGIVKAAEATIQLTKLGVTVERTEKTFVAISGSEETAAENLEAMREATRGAVSDMDAMQQASRLLQMGLADDADGLREITEMAVTLGRAMGRDATTAIEEFSLLLANTSIPRLDTFGISASNVRNRIDELLERYPHLTREQAFMQATMEEGTEAMEALTGVADDNAEAVETGAAAWQNFKNEIGGAYSSFAQLLRLATPVLEWLTEQLRTLNDLTEQYGYFEARIRSMVSLVTLGNYSPYSYGDMPTMPAVPDYRTGSAADRRAAMQQQNVTMYGPQFIGVQNPQDMLGQLQAMNP